MDIEADAARFARALHAAEDNVGRLTREAVTADEAYTKAVRRRNGRTSDQVEVKRRASILADAALEAAEAALAKVRAEIEAYDRRVKREGAARRRQAERDRQPCLF